MPPLSNTTALSRAELPELVLVPGIVSDQLSNWMFAALAAAQAAVYFTAPILGLRRCV
jgi:hypothetical protein